MQLNYKKMFSPFQLNAPSNVKVVLILANIYAQQGHFFVLWNLGPIQTIVSAKNVIYIKEIIRIGWK